MPTTDTSLQADLKAVRDKINRIEATLAGPMTTMDYLNGIHDLVSLERALRDMINALALRIPPYREDEHNALE